MHRNLLVSLTLTAFVAVVLTSSVTLAQKDATMRGPTRASGKQRLSEVLPEKLGAFVLRSGADRNLAVHEAIGVGKLLVGDTISSGLVINSGRNEVVLSTDEREDIVIGSGVLLSAGGCTSVRSCDESGNCTESCEGSCSRNQECIRVTVNDPNGGTRSWCECITVPK